MVKLANNPELKTPADEHWGYPFGVDGLLGTEEACKFLGGISRYTLDNWARDGKIRKGKTDGRIVICRRSVQEYVSGLEV